MKRILKELMLLNICEMKALDLNEKFLNQLSNMKIIDV